MKPRTIPLEDAFSFQEGPGVRKWQFTTSGIKLLNVGNILPIGELDLEKTDRCLSREEVEKRYKHFLLDEGDLVIASSGISFDDDGLLRTRGAFVHRSHLPLCLNTSTIRFKPKADSDLRFLRYWLDSYEFRSQITRLVTGSAQQNFGPSHLENLRITLPDSTEQRRIAGELERADGLRRTRRYALELADTFLPAAFLQLFGTPAENPMGFDRTTIGDALRLKSGESMTAANMGAGGRFPVYGGNGISGYHTSFQFEDRQIVIGRVGAYCGAVHYTEPKCWISDNALYAVEKDARLDDIYLIHALMQAKLNQYADSSGQPLISQGRLEKVALVVPPLPLQTRFAELVARHERLRSAQRESLRQAEHLFQSLLHRAFIN